MYLTNSLTEQYKCSVGVINKDVQGKKNPQIHCCIGSDKITTKNIIINEKKNYIL